MATDKIRHPATAPHHARTAEFLDAALASVPRSDQRRWGSLYVHGLLTAEGRKTVRAVANAVGHSIEQNLNQFISKSPWAWEPVRRALAEQLQAAAQPRAWVVHPLVISKLGRHSVGVEQRFVPELGRVVSCQCATGVWLASEQFSCPVDWRLDLTERWTDHPERRRRAGIPAPVRPADPHRHAVDMVARMAEAWGLERRPVVMDLRGAEHAGQICRELHERGLPYVVRVGTPARLLVPADTGSGPAVRAAARHADPVAELDSLLRLQRLPVEWPDQAGKPRVSAVGSVLARGRAGGEELLLLGSWSDPAQPRPDAYWVSNLTRQPLGRLFRTARLSLRVDRDQADLGAELGLRDFEGRSFPGWHHHMTMVSLAHAVTLLTPAAVTRAAARVEPAA